MIYFISKGLPELIITIEEFTVLRKLIAFKIRAKIKLQITAEISKLYHGIVVDRKSMCGAGGGRSYLFLAVCIDPVLTVCLRTLPKRLKIF